MLEKQEANEKLQEVLNAHIGGKEVGDMLVDHHDHKVPLSTLAQRTGISRPGVLKRMRRARGRLRKLRMWPRRWG